MKIQQDGGSTSGPAPTDSASAQISRKQRAAPAPEEAQQPAADAVETSEIARQLETDPVRQLRLDRLRDEVRNGTYSVPASELSARIVSAHLSDFTKRS